MGFSSLLFFLITAYIVIATLYLGAVIYRYRKQYIASIKDIAEYERHYLDGKDGNASLSDPNIPPDGIYDDKFSHVETPQVTNTRWNEPNFRPVKDLREKQRIKNISTILLYQLCAAALIYIGVFFVCLTPSNLTIVFLLSAFLILSVALLPTTFIIKYFTSYEWRIVPIALVSLFAGIKYYLCSGTVTSAELGLLCLILALTTLCKIGIAPDFESALFVKNSFNNPKHRSDPEINIPGWLALLFILLAAGVLIAILTGIFHFSTLFPPPYAR